MFVIKRSGEREQYDPRKTRASLMKSGISQSEADGIMERLQAQLYDGISTEEIYRRLNMMLDSERKVKFGLKKAIMNLGPDGYVFETFTARLFQSLGYDIKLRQILQGQCVQHEVDVVLVKDGLKEIVECKFHNSQGIKCSIQTALYTFGRFLDLQNVENLESVWLVTNTRFSSDVVRYAQCMNIKLLGWKYPEEKSLEDLIEEHRLYPMTVLDMKRSDMMGLLEHDFVLARDLVDKKDEIRRALPWLDISRMSKSVDLLMG
jgi:hypothetical protein